VKESLAKAKLIPDGKTKDPEVLRRYAKKLLFRDVNEVLPLQPVTMSQMEDFIVKADQLILSVLLDDTIPITDLPPSILTELFNQKTKELNKEWKERTELQLDSMLSNLGNIEGLPTKETVLGATKIKPVNWDPLSIPKSADQSEESHREQMMALTMGVNSINKYGKQFENTCYTEGILNNGAPGAGKTFVLQAQGLYAMTQGLRVMSTSLMAARSNAIGGYHLHRLFQWEVGKTANLFRLAEVRLLEIAWCQLT